MTRLRVLRPNFWTDGQILALTPFSRLFVLGLWTFCNAHGEINFAVEELKAKIFPSDNIDIHKLLEELLTTNVVKISGGKIFISNFKKYQKEADLPEPEPIKEELVQDIFSHWQITLKHQMAKLDSVRRKAVSLRLREGYSVERIKNAINGITLSTYHMGLNDQKTVYDDLEFICRNGKNVDRFADLWAAHEYKRKKAEELQSRAIANIAIPESLNDEEWLQRSQLAKNAVRNFHELLKEKKKAINE